MLGVQEEFPLWMRLQVPLIYGKVVLTGPALAMPGGMTLALFPARCQLGRVRRPPLDTNHLLIVLYSVGF